MVIFTDSACHLNAKYARVRADVVGWRGLRLREVVGDEVGTLEEEEYVAEAVTLQGTVQSDPVGILKDRHIHTLFFKVMPQFLVLADFQEAILICLCTAQEPALSQQIMCSCYK